TALNMLGLFDPTYGRGYHEENDWSARAIAAGFAIARANRALVFHHGKASFGDEAKELDARNARRLVQRYPDYLERNRVFEHGPHARVAAQQAQLQLGKPPAVTHAKSLPT